MCSIASWRRSHVAGGTVEKVQSWNVRKESGHPTTFRADSIHWLPQSAGPIAGGGQCSSSTHHRIGKALVAGLVLPLVAIVTAGSDPIAHAARPRRHVDGRRRVARHPPSRVRSGERLGWRRRSPSFQARSRSPPRFRRSRRAPRSSVPAPARRSSTPTAIGSSTHSTSRSWSVTSRSRATPRPPRAP